MTTVIKTIRALALAAAMGLTPAAAQAAQPKAANAAKRNTLIVISKRDLNLKVYGAENGDTTLLATYPACLSKNKGQKQRRGDMRTPESPQRRPFKIVSIENSKAWKHDFGDGRGSILSYGHWFMRLETPFSGIGIHGSTNNEGTVPGRASEGCIRLRDTDLLHLVANYARPGMTVIIKTETQGQLPFETRLKNSADTGHKIEPPTAANAADEKPIKSPH